MLAGGHGGGIRSGKKESIRVRSGAAGVGLFVNSATCSCWGLEEAPKGKRFEQGQAKSSCLQMRFVKGQVLSDRTFFL